jgi:chromosome segregation ATPase
MDLDSQIEKTLQKFTLKIQELTAERDALESQKNELIRQAKQSDMFKSNFTEQFNDCNSKIAIQNEKKFKFKDTYEAVQVELKINEVKLNKQQSANSKYEQTMQAKIEEIKQANLKGAEERKIKLKKDAERLNSLKTENELLDKRLYDEDRLIESLDIKVAKINEKEKARSSLLNDFIKQVTDSRYTHSSVHTNPTTHPTNPSI